jgi:hypothetical protein
LRRPRAQRGEGSRWVLHDCLIDGTRIEYSAGAFAGGSDKAEAVAVTIWPSLVVAVMTAIVIPCAVTMIAPALDRRINIARFPDPDALARFLLLGGAR